jgi:CBS domain-containing protein
MRPTKVMTVEPATPLKEIVARLAEHRVSTVPVVNDAGWRRATS